MYLSPRYQKINDIENDEAYYRHYLKASLPHKLLFEEKFNTFLSNITPGKLLDIGCGTGEFLMVGKLRGWKTVGIDISAWVCNYLLEQGYKDIFNCSLEEAGFPDETFHLVHMSHVLEHISKPSQFLEEVYRILKPMGFVLIEVPNERLFPWNYILLNMLKIGHFSSSGISEKHVNLFTKKTLVTLLKRSLLTPLFVQEEGFASKGRITTPAFEEKTFVMRLALLLCRRRLDVLSGMGRYLVALARK